MNRIKLAKMIVSKVATIGSSIIISAAIADHLPSNLTWPRKIAVVVGSYMIADAINDVVKKQTDKAIDDVVAGYNLAHKYFKKA